MSDVAHNADYGAPLMKGPLTDVREVETWWWVRSDDPHPDSVSCREWLARRCQRIYGGRVEVIRQTITTVTTVYDETLGGTQ